MINKPMTKSCITMDLEKQIVFLAKRLILVRKVRCFRSIFWVFFLQIGWVWGSRILSYAPQTSVKKRWIPN